MTDDVKLCPRCGGAVVISGATVDVYLYPSGDMQVTQQARWESNSSARCLRRECDWTGPARLLAGGPRPWERK